MVLLRHVSAVCAPGQIDALEHGRQFGYERDFIEGKLGSRTLARLAPGQEASDLCVAAARQLESEGTALADIGALIVCTQNPDGHGIPHTSAVVQHKLDLPESCACFDIALGCSGYVYGLAIMKAFMEAHKITRGLFFTADPYSRIIDPADQATSLLFGDAATASLLEAGGDGWALRDCVFATRGAGGDAINNRSGAVRMEGRDVFNFAMTSVPIQIQALLQRNGLTKNEIDLYAFHQGSRYIVEKLRSRMGLDERRAPVELEGIGNSVSSAVPIVLARHMNTPGLKRTLISGFGAGLSYASAVLERTFSPLP